MKKVKSSTKSTTLRQGYGFQVGNHVIEIHAESEQKAFMILGKNYWRFIDKAGDVELLGERKQML